MLCLSGFAVLRVGAKRFRSEVVGGGDASRQPLLGHMRDPGRLAAVSLGVAFKSRRALRGMADDGHRTAACGDSWFRGERPARVAARRRVIGAVSEMAVVALVGVVLLSSAAWARGLSTRRFERPSDDSRPTMLWY